MKKIYHDYFPSGKWRRIFFFMKLKLILLLSAGTLGAAPSYSQAQRFDVSYNNESLFSVFDDLKARSGYQFFFQKDLVEGVSVTHTQRNATVEEVIEAILGKHGLTYALHGNVFVVRQSEKQPPPDNQRAATVTPIIPIRGIVTHPDGSPVPGATVLLKGTQTGASTDANGEFTISSLNLPSNAILTVSFIGKKSVEVSYTGQQTVRVTLEDDAESIDEVVVTGLFERRKESFTGSAVTFSQEDLKLYGNSNLINSLKNLDPSFIVEDNVEFGSDPNRIPEMRLRGTSSLQSDYEGDPNQPHFILDGFPSTAAEIFDLDMNRVASVTILKDAAAKALYGSKAANGVVVVETRLPQAGRLRVTYTGDLNVEVPDLTSYDLVNAREKLEVEVNAGRFSSTNPTNAQHLRSQYNELLKAVEQGVDTYWLSKPLRTGVGQKHSLRLEGGEGAIRYGVDFAYNNVAGVMKESNRETISGGVTLSYRFKNLTFRNMLNVAFNRADDSPYGQFSEYSQLNSYWTPYDENGNLLQFLGSYSERPSDTGVRYANPLYNASIGTKNFSKYTKITENFYAEWQVMPQFKLIGRFGYTHETNAREDFYPGSHSRFASMINDDYFRRGTYSIMDGEARNINADITANYTLTLGKHMILANGAWNISSEDSKSHGMAAEGFLNNRVDDITFAKQYALNGKPSGSETILREVGFTFAANYSYDDRYLADVSIRTNASSAFGSNNRWGTFWSVGLGWNLHHEKFLRDSRAINLFKIRGSVGYTGNQKFDSFQALRTYKLYTDRTYDNLTGAYLMAMANNDLKWQQTRDINGGLDIRLFNRLNVRFDTYISITDDLLVDYTTPTSTGFSSYKENIGKVENGGFDMTASYQVYRNAAKDSYININASVAHNVNRIKKISSALQNYNDEQVESIQGGSYTNPVSLYREGVSMSAIWAVRSLGIDPASGKELFVKKNGTTTYDWNSDDLIVAGDATPKFRGNFGLSSEFRGIGFAFSFSYRVGGYYYNQSLVTRVENVDVAYNVDRRVLEQSWQNPGDVAAYKKIKTLKSETRYTTRFVEKENELKLSSINVYYDFKHHNIKYLERLRAAFYMNDVFTVSTVKAERGLNYPFARTFSFSLTATF